MIDHFPKQAGVYAIRHVGSGKVYIGSAQNLWRRGRDHVRMLRGGYHPNPHLQRAVLVDVIRAEKAAGASYRMLAARYQCSVATLHRLVHGIGPLYSSHKPC